MKRHWIPALLLLLAALPVADAQAPRTNNNPGAAEAGGDSPGPARFWQASVGGGHYMVALDRIASVSRHQYVLDGAAIVDEVTVDTVGQALARFYFIEPITAGVAAGSVSALTERAKQLTDLAANRAGTDVHNMVVKQYPTTTHAKTIEFRVMSSAQLGSLYESVRTAWENNRGRRFRAE
jgi:hypothetical protein